MSRSRGDSRFEPTVEDQPFTLADVDRSGHRKTPVFAYQIAGISMLGPTVRP